MSPSSFAESLVAAFAASDAAAYFGHFHPDATFLFHDTPGLVGSRADYEALWAEWETDAGFRVLACESTDRHVQQHGDLAVFTHTVRTRRLVDDTEEELHERETIVLRREGDTWTCIHEHLSPDPAWS
jgi:ketosteroid isomerase-like protein